MGALENLYRRFGDRAEFFVVYIREAHPENGWVLAENRREGIALRDPESTAVRADTASACAVGIPVLVDEIDDEVTRWYGGWPDRLYLVGADGRIAYQGGPGPFGFLPGELEAALATELV